ncbi:SH3 beta-barrel fold-containing protein [Pedobacter sp.]
MKSLIFKTAWQLMGKFNNFSECLRHAWRLIKLKTKMLKGVVEFSYYKVDGTIRTAVGTLQERFVNYEYKGQTSSNKVFTYYDVEQGAFRCFKIENLV